MVLSTVLCKMALSEDDFKNKKIHFFYVKEKKTCSVNYFNINLVWWPFIPGSLCAFCFIRKWSGRLSWASDMVFLETLSVTFSGGGEVIERRLSVCKSINLKWFCSNSMLNSLNKYLWPFVLKIKDFCRVLSRFKFDLCYQSQGLNLTQRFSLIWCLSSSH